MLYNITYRMKGDSDRVASRVTPGEANEHPTLEELKAFVKKHAGNDAEYESSMAHPGWDAEEKRKGGMTIHKIKKITS
jgi:hypothetical protein